VKRPAAPAVATALAAGFVGGAGTLVALMARGRLTLDTAWGRSITPLRPRTVRFEVPREEVFDYLAAPYLGRTPAALRDHLRVWERGDDLVIASHFSELAGYTAETVEAVHFERPARITFRHLRGPVPHAVESFTLFDEDGGTRLEYEGEVGLDGWSVGRVAARWWVVPAWDRVVTESLAASKDGVEALAARRRARATGDDGQTPTATKDA
jgi:hypothetical protein